jgi:hypothetical protein
LETPANAKEVMKYWLLLLVFFPGFLFAQPDSTAAAEDYSQYENLDFADAGAKRYCTSKVLDLSPQKLISIGYDFQGPYKLEEAGNRNTNFDFSSGERLQLNIPVVSRNSIIVQAGLNYAAQRYSGTADSTAVLGRNLLDKGLNTLGLNLTVFKPLNEKRFLLFQGSSDLNGDYSFNKLLPLKYMKYSAALVYGWKMHERLMYGFGLSRTYRVGEMNYIPVFLYNYTAPNRKWGAEVLFPARAHYRRTFSSRSLLLLGYELEGQSYRMNIDGNFPYQNFGNPLSPETLINGAELRRGELRIRAVFERSIKNFIWISAQAGFRYNYSFNVDEVPSGDFFRGFFGDQTYGMENLLGNSFYSMVSINLVSP